jgi:hypothetical protein
MRKLLLLSLAALALSGATAIAGNGNIGDYLPQDKFEGHFMKVGYSPRAQELFAKMQAALNRNLEWLTDVRKNLKPGEPLPYDEKLGLTQDEYKEFLDLNKQAQLKEILTREIRVVHNSDDTISLDGGADLKQLAAIKFDIVHNTVITPYWDLEHARVVDNSGKGEGGVFGPHTGLLFHYEGGDPGSSIDNISGKTVTVIVGQIAGTNKRFLSYNVIVMENGERTAAIDMILEYELK